MVAALVRRCSVTSVTVYSLRPGASARGRRIWSAEWGSTAPAGGVEEGEELVDGLVGDVFGGLAAFAQADEGGGGGVGGLGGQSERGPLNVRQARPIGQLDLGGEPARGEPGKGAGAHPLGDRRVEPGDAGGPVNPEQGAAVGQGDRAEPGRLDPGVELAAAAGVEAGLGHRQGDRGPERGTGARARSSPGTGTTGPRG